MGLLNDYSGGSGLLGLGKIQRPSFAHQIIMANMLVGLNNLLYKNNYLVLTESCVDKNDLNSKAPDVIVYDRNINPIMFIEITTSKEANKISEKAIDLMKVYNILESFVYDYENKHWVKHTNIKESNMLYSYSDLFKIDLQQFL